MIASIKPQYNGYAAKVCMCVCPSALALFLCMNDGADAFLYFGNDSQRIDVRIVVEGGEACCKDSMRGVVERS